MRMWRGVGLAAALAVAAAVGGAGGAGAADGPKPSLSEPSLSPNGAEIAFVSGGDIWTVPARGGTAQLLVTDPATESRPLYSPDGKALAFVSNRNGAANIYVLTFATGEVRRLTYSDANEQLDAWSRDGKWIYLTSGASDVARQTDVLRVAAGGGTPLEVSRERYLNEFNAAPSPDGKSVALMAKGMSNNQWWRNGHSHIDEAELWLKPIAAGAPYRLLLGASSKRLWPMWRPDGGALYFMSDEGGSENLWRLPVGTGSARAERLTDFKSGRALWPTMAYDGSAIVFERGFSIWKADPRTGATSEVPIMLRGAPAAAGERRLLETSFRDLALSPDGKKIAVIAHGEVFAASAKDGGAAQRISESVAAESDIAWSPDSKRLIYVADRGLDARIVEYDFNTLKAKDLTSAPGIDAAPVYSPDGKMIAYAHGAHEIHVITLGKDGAANKDAVIFNGALDRNGGSRFTWSPDSQWIAFALTDPRSFRNVSVIPAAGGAARPISFLANGNAAEQIAWSPDGKFILFDTAQRSEDPRIVRVDLLPHLPKYREDAFRDLFTSKDAPDRKTSPGPTPGPTSTPAPPATTPAPEPASPPDPAAVVAVAGADPKAKPPAKPEPVKIVFEGIRERASFIPLGLGADNPVISPDGKMLVFTASFSGQQNLYSYGLDELAKDPPSVQQITSSRRFKSSFAFTPDSKEIYYLDGGSVMSTTVEAPKPKAITVTADMTARFETEKMVVFDEAWSDLNRFFFDPKFNGKDWTALRAQWTPYIAGARTGDELRRDINLLIGELNASHSGINRPTEGAPAARVGDIGLRFDREAYEAGKGLVIREVVALGPADLEGTIKPGETLTAVNGRAVGPTTNLDSLLMDRIGKRVVLTIGAKGDAKATREAVVRPVSPGTASGLLYRQWVSERRAYVDKVSNGQLGYVHIIDMSSESLQQLYIDLDAQNQGKKGVVIDVRNNNGGFINGYVLDVFSRKNFLTMTPRDLFAVPSRQSLGQRALGLPTVLVTNESSLSDAEDFTEGYRSLGLGKVVGTPTAGWIIYTSSAGLIDGSSVRVPSVRIQDMKGGDMEMHPRPVDVTVVRALGETVDGKDTQLDAAVAELLKGLGR
ncbi:S41 family peptidase [soil metagenome]